MKHYFKNSEQLHEEDEITLAYRYYDHDLCFKTNNNLFSKNELDYHSRLLLAHIEAGTYQHCLDLGCGYGFIGICLSKRFKTAVDFIDITPQAIIYTEKNIILNNISAYKVTQSDGIQNETKYDLITLNPPIHAGKEVCYRLYQEGVAHLQRTGIMMIVIAKKHGAVSTLAYLKTFCDVKIITKKKGVYIMALCKK